MVPRVQVVPGIATIRDPGRFEPTLLGGTAREVLDWFARG